jgi:hypothetical protein
MISSYINLDSYKYKTLKKPTLFILSYESKNQFAINQDEIFNSILEGVLVD